MRIDEPEAKVYSYKQKLYYLFIKIIPYQILFWWFINMWYDKICYHIEDTWHCAVLDLNSTTTNGTETDEAKTPYSDDWYGPYYNYAF